MKNVQIIDGAINSAYSIYAFDDEQYNLIFPSDGQDIEFVEDLRDRLTPDLLRKVFKRVWERPVKKPDVVGLHGTLFYELLNKKQFYPNKSGMNVAVPSYLPLTSMVGFSEKDGKMKNVQLIDGAVSCNYPIYAFTQDQFLTLFPAQGQDIEFIEDANSRLGRDVLETTLRDLRSRCVQKPEVVGIHGTLFYQLLDKKEFYPNKSELDNPG